MSKFYASGSTISSLINSRDNVTACRAAMDTAIKAANGRTLVVPKMWGGYLPHVLKTTPALEVVADRDEFKKQRDAAIEAARTAAEDRAARRDARVARMLPGCSTNVLQFSTEESERRNKERRAAEARRDARRQQLAADCQARKGGAGSNNKGKKAA